MGRHPGKFGAVALTIALFASVVPFGAYACNGTDVAFSKYPALDASETVKGKNGTSYLNAAGQLLLPDTMARVSPARARAIAEKFIKEQFDEPPLPLTFKKVESVHGKLIYQFQSQKIPDINVKYHLGPVNFKVDYLVLDVDAKTGNLYIANGCGGAPNQLLYTYNQNDFLSAPLNDDEVFVSNNTNFIARKTGNKIKVDGKIDPEEWKDTGHRYFYLGNYISHMSSVFHDKASYYAEVWAQIDDKNIYFAVKTDTPGWIGIMLKGNPNLGMLAAYHDAKVLTSDGEFTDRHFTERKDKTFFLEKDTSDHIIEGGVQQGDFYTYEISFPLDTGDESDDIKLENGRAYNMMLTVGNTLKHYGIFTLSDDHKDHDHSKNNKEFVNVYASNETTLRIGDLPEKDIFGNPAAPVFAGFTSGFDKDKSDTHFHFANFYAKSFPARASLSLYIGISAVALGFLAMLIMLVSLRKNGKQKTGRSNSIDLFRYDWVHRFATWKHFRTAFIVPTLVVFAVIVLLGFIDIQDGRKNIATIYTWTLWWTMIIFSFIVIGRFWCTMCPFAAIGDFVQKIVSFNKRLPGSLQNMGIQALGFIVLTLLFTLMAFQRSPFITSTVIIVILLATVLFSVIYERRSFCRHLCPIGAVIGLYSAVTPFEISPCDQGKCEKHLEKTCERACPMLEKPQHGGSNVYCNFCMKCIDACPSGNLSLKLRPAGTELVRPARRKAPIQALASLLLLGVIIVETIAMTSAWVPLKNTVSDLLGGASDTLSYIIVFSVVVLLPLIVFYLFSWLLSFWVGKEKANAVNVLSDFAIVFIPIGISLHLAHNIQHLLMEGAIAIPATLRVLDGMGINQSFINWNPIPPLGFETLFIIQMGIIISGFIFTKWLLYKKLRQHKEPLADLYKYSTAMSLYAITVIVSIIYVLGLPMSGRHVH